MFNPWGRSQYPKNLTLLPRSRQRLRKNSSKPIQIRQFGRISRWVWAAFMKKALQKLSQIWCVFRFMLLEPGLIFHLHSHRWCWRVALLRDLNLQLSKGKPFENRIKQTGGCRSGVDLTFAKDWKLKVQKNLDVLIQFQVFPQRNLFASVNNQLHLEAASSSSWAVTSCDKS